MIERSDENFHPIKKVPLGFRSAFDFKPFRSSHPPPFRTPGMEEAGEGWFYRTTSGRNKVYETAPPIFATKVS